MKPTYEQLEQQLAAVISERDAAVNAERIWEKTMMQACGEDGPASVADEIAALRAQRDTALQSLRQQLAAVVADNAGLKAGVTYFAYSPEYGFDYFKDKQSAVNTAQEEIDAYREDADDGWSEDVQRVSWGVVIQQAQGFDAQNLHTSDSQHTYQTCDYKLVDAIKTPATDAYLAEVRAQGVEMLLASLPPHYTSRSDIEEFAAQLRQGVEQ